MTTATDFMEKYDKELSSQMRAAAAGFVLLSIIDFLVMILLGSFMDGFALPLTTPYVADAPAPAPYGMPGAAVKYDGHSGMGHSQAELQAPMEAQYSQQYSQQGSLPYHYSDPQGAPHVMFQTGPANAGPLPPQAAGSPAPAAYPPMTGGNVYVA